MTDRCCKQCKRTMPEDRFYPIRGRGWRVVKCFDCASANMAKWSRTSLSQFDPNKVREVDE